MDNRCEPWIVVSGELREPTRVLCLRYMSGSVPPTVQKTDGTCHSLPNEPKSSLAEIGGMSTTRPLPKCVWKAVRTRAVASESLRTSWY